MLLHLKAGDGDLMLITEQALLTKCAWKLHSINRAALFNAHFCNDHSLIYCLLLSAVIAMDHLDSDLTDRQTF